MSVLGQTRSAALRLRSCLLVRWRSLDRTPQAPAPLPFGTRVAGDVGPASWRASRHCAGPRGEARGGAPALSPALVFPLHPLSLLRARALRRVSAALRPRRPLYCGSRQGDNPSGGNAHGFFCAGRTPPFGGAPPRAAPSTPCAGPPQGGGALVACAQARRGSHCFTLQGRRSRSAGVADNPRASFRRSFEGETPQARFPLWTRFNPPAPRGGLKAACSGTSASSASIHLFSPKACTAPAGARAAPAPGF